MKSFFSNYKHFMIGLSLIISACQSRVKENDIIARVNKKEISVRDYLNLYETLKPRDVELQGEEKQKIKNFVIQSLVRRNVILSNAEQKKIKVSNEELSKGIQNFKSGYTDRNFRESLLEGMVDEAEWTEQVRQSILVEKLFEASDKEVSPPTMEDALDFYQNNTSQYVKHALVKALHIVVADESVIQDIQKRIKKNPRQFVELAREFSTGPEAQKDALIEVEKGVLPEEIDSVLFSLPLGNLSPIIKSDYGYHLLIVKSRSPAVNLDFQQVKNQIFEDLYNKKKNLWLIKFEERLIHGAEIEYNRELIREL